MILTIFILFLAITFLLCIVGYYLRVNEMLIFGFLMFGFLAIPLISESLEYKSGELEQTTYDYINETLSLTEAETTYNYETYKGTVWFGIFFVFISLSGMFYWYSGYKANKKEDDD